MCVPEGVSSLVQRLTKKRSKRTLIEGFCGRQRPAREMGKEEEKREGRTSVKKEVKRVGTRDYRIL